MQKAGDRVRVNVELIDAKNDNHIWAKIYAQNHDADPALPLTYHLLAESYAGPLTMRILRVDPQWPIA